MKIFMVIAVTFCGCRKSNSDIPTSAPVPPFVEVLVTVPIKEMRVGDSRYTYYWALWIDRGRHCWLNGTVGSTSQARTPEDIQVICIGDRVFDVVIPRRYISDAPSPTPYTVSSVLVTGLSDESMQIHNLEEAKEQP